MYGKIENREAGKPENVLKSWTKILKELRAIEARQESVLICGDWNRSVGTGNNGVVGNKCEVSYGGKLIRELIASGELMNTKQAIPSLLSNAGTWVEIDEAAINKLQDSRTPLAEPFSRSLCPPHEPAFGQYWA